MPACRLGGVAVAIALIAALAAWNANLAGQVSQARRHQADASDLIDTVAHPESRVVALAGGATGNRVLAAFVPGRDRLFLFGSMADPGDGLVYQVWLQRAGGYSSAGTFVPESGGRVFYRIGVDSTRVDGRPHHRGTVGRSSGALGPPRRDGEPVARHNFPRFSCRHP